MGFFTTLLSYETVFQPCFHALVVRGCFHSAFPRCHRMAVFLTLLWFWAAMASYEDDGSGRIMFR